MGRLLPDGVLTVLFPTCEWGCCVSVTSASCAAQDVGDSWDPAPGIPVELFSKQLSCLAVDDGNWSVSSQRYACSKRAKCKQGIFLACQSVRQSEGLVAYNVQGLQVCR
jgi:hypothetical protein